MNEYILVVQEGQGEYLLYAFRVPFLNDLSHPSPPKKTPLADQVICVIKLYYIKLLLTDSVINASDILINSIVL